jgi:hypothetical protein
MAQHDYNIANADGATVRSDLNSVLSAIVSQNSGATAPSTTAAYMWWFDTTTNLLKIRDAADAAWVTVASLSGTTWIPYRSGTALGDAATKTVGTAALADLPNAEDVQTGEIVYAADAGGTDAYAITLAPAPSAYATGMVVNFKANTANTGAATLNVNSLGAKTIKKNQGDDLVDNDIKANQIVAVIYDGTNFQLLSPPSTGSIVFTESFTSADQTITAAGSLTLAHGLSATPTLIKTYLKCTTAQHNYSVNDEVEVEAVHVTRASNFGMGASVVPDGTNLNIRFGAHNNVFDVLDKTSGAIGNITPSSWRFKIKAWA